MANIADFTLLFIQYEIFSQSLKHFMKNKHK